MTINNVSFEKVQQLNLKQTTSVNITKTTEVTVFSGNNTRPDLYSISQKPPTAQSILSNPANVDIIKERIQFILDQNLFEAELDEDQDEIAIINKQIDSLDSITPENAVKFLAELNKTKIRNQTAKPFVDLIMFTINLELGIATDSVSSLKDSGSEGEYKKLLKTFVGKIRKEFDADQGGSGSVNDIVNKGNELIIRLKSAIDQLQNVKDKQKTPTFTEKTVKSKTNIFLSKTQSLNKENSTEKDTSAGSVTDKTSNDNVFSLKNQSEDETTQKKEILIQLMEMLFGPDVDLEKA